MTDLIRRSLDPSIEVTISHAPDLPPARVDPNQLELAILNLAINARDAMPRGGKLRISAQAETVGEAGTGRSPAITSGSSSRTKAWAWTATSLARAVEPFFSTKGIGKGTGPWPVDGPRPRRPARRDARADRARPAAAPPPTSGCPVASEAPAAGEVDARPVVRAARRATILLVDDEELVRTGTADMLSDIGYDVIEATSGRRGAARCFAAALRPTC